MYYKNLNISLPNNWPKIIIMIINESISTKNYLFRTMNQKIKLMLPKWQTTYLESRLPKTMDIMYATI